MNIASTTGHYPAPGSPAIDPPLRGEPMATTLRYTHLAWLIVALGLCGILLPLLFAEGHPVSYLRDSEHGLGSPTTQSSANGVQPEHMYRNQAQPRDDVRDTQITRVIPESGGRPGAVP